MKVEINYAFTECSLLISVRLRCSTSGNIEHNDAGIDQSDRGCLQLSPVFPGTASSCGVQPEMSAVQSGANALNIQPSKQTSAFELVPSTTKRVSLRSAERALSCV